MITNKKLTMLYNEIIYSNELTTKKLKELGFTSNDINGLINQSIIKRIKRGIYEVESVDKLYKYGKSIVSKSHNLAIACFKKCFELDPSHKGVCFQLFIYSISNEDYESAFKYFDILLANNDRFYVPDYKFYIYLLSIITIIPDKYKKYIKDLTINDISVNIKDKRYPDKFAHNKIRSLVLQRKLTYALKILKAFIDRNQKFASQEFIIKALLSQAIEKEKESKNIILGLAENREYQKIIDYLEEKSKHYNIDKRELYILRLVNEILYYKDHLEVPHSKCTSAKTVFEAIDGKNYDLALTISKNYNMRMKISSKENVFTLLLNELCEIIKQNSSQMTNFGLNKDDNEFSSNKISYDEKNKSATLVDIINHLMDCNWESAYKDIELYLEQINKKEYSFLIINLIKICILENDMTFIRPLRILSLIYLDDFSYNIDNYINDFYFILAENNEEKIKLYKEIILKLAELTKDYQLPVRFLQSLNYLEKTDNNLSQKENNEKKVQGSNILEQELENIKDFVDQQCQKLLKQKGVILLGPMEKVKRNIIHELAKQYNDIVSFTMGEEPNKYVVLRYKPVIKEFVDIRKLIMMANIAYYIKDYRTCIDYYLQVLQFGIPNAKSYIRLAFSFLYIGDTNKAIDYLILAHEKSKKEEKQYDFTSIIEELRANSDKEDMKMRIAKLEEEKGLIKLSPTDFENRINFDEINSYILATGLDIELACENFGLTSEQIDIVRLLYAKTYYMQGFEAKGDEFLKFVERTPNKSPNIIHLLEEIKKNRKLYLAKKSIERPISLTLRPIKK